MQKSFVYNTKYGQFSDCIQLPDDHTFTDQEIEAMQIQRRDNWVAYIDSINQAADEPQPVTQP